MVNARTRYKPYDSGWRKNKRSDSLEGDSPAGVDGEGARIRKRRGRKPNSSKKMVLEGVIIPMRSIKRVSLIA